MEIAPGIHSMGQDKGGNVHAFLLDDGQELTLIDTLYDDDGKVVLDEIAQMGRRPADVKHIILTHAHKSHLGGLAALKAASGATVCSHEWEIDIIAGRRKATPVSKIPKRPLAVLHLQLGLALGFGRHVPSDVDRKLKAGDRVGPLEVVETPGHTPGSLSFWWPAKRALFVGDVIATWPELAPGWPGLTLDNPQNLRSVQQLTDFGNADILGVGHGEPITADAAARVRDVAR
ncbi:MAG TPA: MBL fold metallo-hydrolase [Vicinamibacterales bacterium]|nr:MBL fold metallo-hydrolase [Vicinamibacterales bacterium]